MTVTAFGTVMTVTAFGTVMTVTACRFITGNCQVIIAIDIRVETYAVCIGGHQNYNGYPKC